MTEQYTFRAIEQCPMCGYKVTDQQYFGKRLNQSQGLNPRKLQGTEVRIYKCAQCRLVYPNPIPLLSKKDDRHATTELKEFWGERLLSYEHFRDELNVLSRLSNKPLAEMVVLDIGFGLGNSLLTLSPACKEAHGIEPFEIFFNKAIELNGNKLDTSLLKCISFEDAQYRDGQFDFIFFEALQHLPDLEAGIKKVLRWLKPGGIFYVELPSSSYLFNRLINLFYSLQGSGFVVNTNPMHGNYTYYEFSEKCFIDNGKRLGYKVLHHEVFPCNPPVKGILGDLLHFIMKRTDTGMQRSIWLRKD